MDPDEIYYDEGDTLNDVGGFGDPIMDAGFGDVFGLFVVAFVVVAVAGVAMSVRRAKKLHDAGIDPLDPETDLQVRWAQSRTMTPVDRTRAATQTPAPDASSGRGPDKTPEERLAEVDRLHAAGTITSSERDAARAQILGSI